MKLYEYEAKQLLAGEGLLVPDNEFVTSDTFKGLELNIKTIGLSFPVVIKAQVLHGNRGLHGLILEAENRNELTDKIQQLLTSTDANNQPITSILIEPKISFNSEHFVSLGYDTRSRTAQLQFSAAGGVGMDNRGETIVSCEVPITGQISFPDEIDLSLHTTLSKLRNLFFNHDCSSLEINPFVQTKQGWMCLDAKIQLDTAAAFRHPNWQQYPSRSGLGRDWTPRERQAHQVSAQDHRGVAGESFFEFPDGEIGVLASGGGASTLAMDALLLNELKPANYTEYSGNPTRQKVQALADVVLSIPNLKGLYVVGSTANFTDIYETLRGVIDSFVGSQYAQQPGFVVIIRRGGPRWQEAFEYARSQLDPLPIKYRLFGPDFPIVPTAHELKKLLEEEL